MARIVSRMDPFLQDVTSKGTLKGTPNTEPQGYSRNLIGVYQSPYILLCSCYILGVPCLGFALKTL